MRKDLGVLFDFRCSESADVIVWERQCLTSDGHSSLLYTRPTREMARSELDPPGFQAGRRRRPLVGHRPRLRDVAGRARRHSRPARHLGVWKERSGQRIFQQRSEAQRHHLGLNIIASQTPSSKTADVVALQERLQYMTSEHGPLLAMRAGRRATVFGHCAQLESALFAVARSFAGPCGPSQTVLGVGTGGVAKNSRLAHPALPNSDLVRARRQLGFHVQPISEERTSMSCPCCSQHPAMVDLAHESRYVRLKTHVCPWCCVVLDRDVRGSLNMRRVLLPLVDDEPRPRDLRKHLGGMRAAKTKRSRGAPPRQTSPVGRQQGADGV